MSKGIANCPPRPKKPRSATPTKRPLRISVRLIGPDTFKLCYAQLEDRLIWQRSDFYSSITIAFFENQLHEQVNIAKANIVDLTRQQELLELLEVNNGPWPETDRAGKKFLAEFLGQAAEAYFLSSKIIDAEESVVLKRTPCYDSNDLLDENPHLYSRFQAGYLGHAIDGERFDRYSSEEYLERTKSYTLIRLDSYYEPVWVRSSLLDRVRRKSPSEARMIGSIIRAQTTELISSGKLHWGLIANMDSDPPERAFSHLRHHGLFLLTA